MKKKIWAVLALVLTVLVLLAAILYLIPLVHEKQCKTRVYDDLEAQLDTVRDSVIGIIPKTERDGAVTYGGGGSGVIFAEEDGLYYAVTARHCVSREDSTYKIYTTKTTVQQAEGTEAAAGLLDIVDNSFYESLSDATVEYISDTTDLAIVSFTSGDDLTAAKLGTAEPQTGDRLMCIGNPEGDKFIVTYGKVLSGPEEITSVSKTGDDGAGTLTYRAIEHNAYIYFGNSGGPAFNENMEIAGINTSGSMSLFGMFKTAEMVPCTDVQTCITEWENR